jgi:putative tributyrin esterase
MYTIPQEDLPGTDFHHYSASLGREKVARVVIPPGSVPQKGWRSCYFLHAFGGNRLSLLRYLNFPTPELSCDQLLICPESGRRWFINDNAGNRYEDYLIYDLMPAIDAAFNTGRSAGARTIGGFSMGGATAVYLSLRYPNLFSASFAYAGAFYASQRTGDPYAAHRASGCLMPTEREHNRVWGPPNSIVRQIYDPDEYINRMVAQGAAPKIALEVGVEDYQRVIDQSRKIHLALAAAGLDHFYAEHPGDHSWPFAAVATKRALLKLAADDLCAKRSI